MKTNMCAFVKVLGYILIQISKIVAIIIALIVTIIAFIIMLPIAMLLSPVLFVAPCFSMNTPDRFINDLSRILIPLFGISDIISIFTNRGTITKSAVHTYVHYCFDVFAFDVIFVFCGIALTLIINEYPKVKIILVEKYRTYLRKCEK